MSGFKAYVYLTFHFVINKSLIKLKKKIWYILRKKCPLLASWRQNVSARSRKFFIPVYILALLNGSNLNPLSTSLKPWKTDLIKKYKPK